jgi:ribonucleotide reductase alpha subunit
VQHLDFLTEQEKAVYKTAFELDQRWIVEHAADRAPFICQSQSVNVFLPANVHKRDLHQIHFMAWKRGVKSLYYCRSLSIQRADNVSEAAVRPAEFTGAVAAGGGRGGKCDGLRGVSGLSVISGDNVSQILNLDFVGALRVKLQRARDDVVAAGQDDCDRAQFLALRIRAYSVWQDLEIALKGQRA